MLLNYERVCMEFERKKHLHIGFPTFKLPGSTKKSFKTVQLNIVFEDFSIWLLGFWIKLSCLYTPQGHYFISSFRYRWMCENKIERKSTFKFIPLSPLNWTLCLDLRESGIRWVSLYLWSLHQFVIKYSLIAWNHLVFFSQIGAKIKRASCKQTQMNNPFLRI